MEVYFIKEHIVATNKILYNLSPEDIKMKKLFYI